MILLTPSCANSSSPTAAIRTPTMSLSQSSSTPSAPASGWPRISSPTATSCRGLADLDLDCVEHGTFSLAEVASLEVGLRLGIERDILFSTRTLWSTWLKIADDAGSLRAAERIIAWLERET